MNLIQKIAAALFGREIKRLDAGWAAANQQLFTWRLRAEELEEERAQLMSENAELRRSNIELRSRVPLRGSEFTRPSRRIAP